MEIIYRAADGTISEDKKECEKDEEYPNKIKKEVHIYDKDFKELSFDDTYWEEKTCFFTFEELDLFFAEYDYDLFRTVRDYEKPLGNSYLIAKDFQEKLEENIQ